MAIDYGDHGYPAGPAPRRHGLPLALRAPLSGRTWRTFLYLQLSLPISIAGFVWAVTTVSLGLGLMVTFIGLPVLALGLAGARVLGAVERTRARLLLGTDVEGPLPVQAENRNGGFMGWVWALLKSGASWRHMVYAVVQMPWAVCTFIASLLLQFLGWSLLLYPAYQWMYPTWWGQPGMQVFSDRTHEVYLDNPFEVAAASAVGLVIVLATPWLLHGMATMDRMLVKSLLGPSKLAVRVARLEQDRGVVVDTAAADLRRIERDLHDGAQARLVALAMDLGLAKEKLLEDPEAAARMVDEAHGEVKIALQELRDLARGIHPAVLTDRGLDAALSSVAGRCTVPVEVHVDLDSRPAPAIEGIAYFTVSELLQNISKHSRARSARVEVWRSGNRVMLQVWDDGRGGASTADGTGLAGLAERLGSVDGLLVVDSPAGGPTTVTAELPWRDR